jgi:hypothetical protein
MKTNTIFSVSKRLPKRTLLPVESRTSKAEASLIAFVSGMDFDSESDMAAGLKKSTFFLLSHRMEEQILQARGEMIKLHRD